MSKAFFVSGSQYLRYDVQNDSADPGYPKPLSSAWGGIDQTAFANGFDCAIDPGTGSGKLYLFKGPSYLTINQASLTVEEAEKPISGNWPGMAEAGFADGIDAVVSWGNGKLYIVRGDAYVSYDLESDAVDGGPSPIAGNWPGLAEAGFSENIDAMVNLGAGKVYIFKTDKYLRYDIASDSADEGYPLPIAANWSGLAEAGFTSGLVAWAQGDGARPVVPADDFFGTQVWNWNGMVSATQDVPRSAWFPGSNPADPNDYQGHGTEIFNYVFHSDGTIRKGQPHMRNRPGSFAWLNNNPGNLTGVPGGPNYGQYPGKFAWHNFLIFPSFDAGYAAIAPFLRGPNFRDLNLLEAFKKYAPAGDGGNDPVRYANETAAAAGVPITTLVRDLTDDQMRFVQDKIVAIEGAIPGSVLAADSPELPPEVRALLG